MSFSKRILAFILMLVMLVPTLLVAIPASASTGAGGNTVTDTQTYTKKKVVSVVYDTSYSMSYASAKDNRSQYAKYASQTLMSLLDDADKLVFFPLSASNGSSNVNVSTANYKESWARVDVDLDHPSGRSEAIKQALSSDKVFGRTTGSTPAYAIQAAVQELIDAGMKTNEEMTINATSDTEYYLVILADGQFDSTTVEIDGVKKGLKDDQIVDHFAEPSKYFSYQCIYLGFGAAKDYSGTPFKTQNGNVTTLTATSVPDLTAKMQQIANQITGRYSTSYTCAEENGQTVVTVDIDSLSFGLRTVSVLMQNSNASLVSAKYGNETLSVANQAKFSGVTLENEDALKGGFSTVLKRTNTKTDFSGGELKLTFMNFTEADKQNLSILLEPSLEIKPYVLHGGKEVDAVYVNSYLKPGDKIQMGFTIHKSGDPDAVIPVGNLSGKTTA
ncbi:MAG: hypothetical protein IJF21_08810, partial [Clostridia bacterium]|nr:hypothetical protein [Clostridia bacterium]